MPLVEDGLTPSEVIALGHGVVNNMVSRYPAWERWREDLVQDVALMYYSGRRHFFLADLYRKYIGRKGFCSAGGASEIGVGDLLDPHREDGPITLTVEQDHSALDVEAARNALRAIYREGCDPHHRSWWKRLAPAFWHCCIRDVKFARNTATKISHLEVAVNYHGVNPRTAKSTLQVGFTHLRNEMKRRLDWSTTRKGDATCPSATVKPRSSTSVKTCASST